MKKLKNQTLQQYTALLSKKAPIPGGGSAAAMSAAMGVSLLMMVAEYSLEKKTKQIDRRLQSLIRKCRIIQGKLIDLVDRDAEAYQEVVDSRNKTKKEKNTALRQAARVPKDVCKLCYQAIDFAPFLVQNGNAYLVADVQIAIELLNGSFQSALILTKQD